LILVFWLSETKVNKDWMYRRTSRNCER